MCDSIYLILARCISHAQEKELISKLQANNEELQEEEASEILQQMGNSLENTPVYTKATALDLQNLRQWLDSTHPKWQTECGLQVREREKAHTCIAYWRRAVGI